MSSTAVPSARSFTALNGTEVKRAIIADITNQLERDTRFSQHLSFAAISWKYRIAVDTYPKEVGDFQIMGGGVLQPKDSRLLEHDEEPVPVDIEGGRSVTSGFEAHGQTANAVRRETGQPVHETKTIGGPAGERITVEVPKVPATAREASDVRREPPSQTDVPGTKGIVARRASIRNRANPGGVEVSPVPGTPQTQADADEIIRRGLEDGTLEEASDGPPNLRK